MSKTGWIILIVCLIVIFCLAVGIFIAGRMFSALFPRQENPAYSDSVSKRYSDLKNPYAEDGVYSVKMKELKELTIDWISGTVTVELSDDDAIRIEETAVDTIQEKDALRYGVSGSKLRIQACAKRHTGKLPEKSLVVSIPRSMAGALKECRLDTVSASIVAGELTMKQLTINTISGTVYLNQVTGGEAVLDTVSGTLELHKCSFDSLQVSSVSASLAASASVKKMNASSVSGPMVLELEGCDEVNANTVSGNVTLDLAAAPRSLSVDTTSGEVHITLPEDASCEIQMDSTSGKLYWNSQLVSAKKFSLGEGEALFEVSSMSGNVYVHTK